MPCTRIVSDDGTINGIICTRGGRRPKACHYCGKSSTVLCDYPIRIPGKRKKDCDVPMCDACTSKGVTPGVDFCRAHYPLAKAAYERRTAKK